jgi:hypothetical protein
MEEAIKQELKLIGYAVLIYAVTLGAYWLFIG